jgi:hypothetical protein
MLVYANDTDIKDKTGNDVREVFKTLNQAPSKMGL